MTKMVKIDTLFMTKAADGAAHTSIAHIWEYPHPPGALAQESQWARSQEWRLLQMANGK